MRSFCLFLSLMLVCLCLLPAPARGDAAYVRTVGHDDTPLMQQRKYRCAYLVRLCLAHGLDGQQTAALLRRHGYAARFDQVAWSPGAPFKPLPTLRFTLGAGCGRNWWGLLYAPSLSAFTDSKKDGVLHMDAAGGQCVQFPLLTRVLRFFQGDFGFIPPAG